MRQGTPSRDRAAEVSLRRAEILRAASELFARQGFAGTTVKDIAESAGMLSGSLYHHFDTKEALAEEIFTAYFDELGDRWEAVLASPWDARAKIEAMLQVALENVDRHTAAARLFTQEWRDLRHVGDVAARWEAVEVMWVDLVRQGVRAGLFRTDIDPTLLYSVAMDVVRGLAGWYHRQSRYSIEAISGAYVGVLMAGLLAPGEAARPAPAEEVAR